MAQEAERSVNIFVLGEDLEAKALGQAAAPTVGSAPAAEPTSEPEPEPEQAPESAPEPAVAAEAAAASAAEEPEQELAAAAAAAAADPAAAPAAAEPEPEPEQEKMVAYVDTPDAEQCRRAFQTRLSRKPDGTYDVPGLFERLDGVDDAITRKHTSNPLRCA